MKEIEEKLTKAEQKEKIRKRYKGIDQDELEVIPALPQEELYDETKEKRVAVYARVSTDDPRQTSSYELQKNHYEDMVSRKPGWKLIKIYADEGISGTSLKHRDAFVEMIKDCRKGEIDLILTKSVSRFARNILDCVGYVRELKTLSPPVGVFFEAENLYTLDKNSEMALSFISTLAQEESHTKSEIMNASIEMRFSRGLFLTPALLGYDQDEEGNLVINEEEAKTVRLIFFMFLYGYSCQQIADELTELGRKTKKGRCQWSVSSIMGILRNERHCGDVLARKTFTPNFLDHKSKKNKQDRNQYRKNNHHEAIVSRKDFIAVQHMLDMGMGGKKSIMPELQVIDEGVLKGFVVVNTTWAGFNKAAYIEAYESVMLNNGDNTEQGTVEIEAGDFDLRGYQVVSGQLFHNPGKITMTAHNKGISFNRNAINGLGESAYIEILVEPVKKLIAVRETDKETRCSLKWFTCTEDGRKPRKLSLAACMPAIFEMMRWNLEYKYRVSGVVKHKDGQSLMIFDPGDAEIIIPKDVIVETAEINELNDEYINQRGRNIFAFPENLAENFGSDYYMHKEASTLGHESDEWNVKKEGTAVSFDDRQVEMDNEAIRTEIDEMIGDMRADT